MDVKQQWPQDLTKLNIPLLNTKHMQRNIYLHCAFILGCWATVCVENNRILKWGPLLYGRETWSIMVREDYRLRVMINIYQSVHTNCVKL
jgi:hypothetical protein